MTPTLTIGFNIVLEELWPTLLKANIPNFMWTVDSIFAANFEIMKNYSQYQNFVLLSVTDCDKDPLNAYFPSLNYAYLPHATDPDLWKKEDAKKEYDIVLFSSVCDYQKDLLSLRERTPKNIFKIMMDMYDALLADPNLMFWDVYQTFKNSGLPDYNESQYARFFYDLAYIVMYEKKVHVVKELSNYNLKIFGNGPWEKYISGKIEHVGSCNRQESMDIMNKSKIILHPHSITLELGLHERILNASVIEAFTLSSESKNIRDAFGDSVGYYNNDDEREVMAKKAREIVLKNHTWDARANQLLKILGC